MRAASMTPVTGGASTDSLAASGGLNVPGRDTDRPLTVPTQSAVPEPSPGERDPTTLTHREAGAMGSYTGAELPSSGPDAVLDQKTTDDRILEGGGEHRRHHSEDDTTRER